MSVATEQRREPLPDSQIPTNPPDLSDRLPRITPRARKPKQTPRPSIPPPSTPQLVEPPTDPTFTHPTRRILSPHDHELFLSSPAYSLIIAFIFNISDSVKDVPLSDVSKAPLHPTVSAVLSILDAASDVLAQNPPDHANGSRFGNPIFRTFISSVASQLPVWLAELFPTTVAGNEGALDELSTYLANSFGSAIRIDYGSGHELNFFIFLLCLNRLSLLPPSSFPQLALILLPRYLSLMRGLQAAYYLEPAGSHGVWGLDDYHFVPFLFGAAQLASHPFIRPLSIHSDATLEGYSDEYLYLDMVRQVNATKTVQGLRWHSPMLDDISGVKEGWGKIYDGMKKMFVNEVLGKLVVMQHFLFGGLVPAVEGMTEAADEDDSAAAEGTGEGEERVAEGHEGHLHNADSWGDCCGIKVPSSVGAAQEMKKRMGGQGLRRLPFD